MKLSPIKFSLVISLVVHGLAIAGAIYIARLLPEFSGGSDTEETTLELVSAPSARESAPEKNAETIPAPPIEQVKPASPIEVIPKAPDDTPEFESGSVSKPGTVAEVASTPPPPQVQSEPPPTNPTFKSDDSSVIPGDDATTVVAASLTRAQPECFSSPQPEYPLAARRRRQEGLVLLSVLVGADGRAVEVTLKETSGFPLLDEAASKHARVRKFIPARVGATAVESEIEVPVRFKLTD